MKLLAKHFAYLSFRYEHELGYFAIIFRQCLLEKKEEKRKRKRTAIFQPFAKQNAHFGIIIMEK